MSLLALPNELLDAVARHIDSPKDLLALLRTNPRLHDVLISRLYTQNREWGYEALDWAASNGRLDTLHRAQLSGLSVNRHDFHLIYSAAAGGHVAVLELLLREGVQGADWVNCSGDCAETPLSAASRGGHTEVVKVLLAHGACTDTESSEGCTPLHYAVQSDFREIAELLIRRGANLMATTFAGETALHRAVEEGLVEMATLLLDMGGKLCFREDPGCLVGLQLAVQSGVLEMVKLLLERGGDPAVVDSTGGTLLHRAARLGHYDICKLLIEYGADASVSDEVGLTPLECAIQSGNLALVQLLVNEGNATLAADDGGISPLHIAAMAGSLDIATMLIERGLDAAAASESGFTPLHFASGDGHVGVMKLLLAKGAAANSRLDTGQTPLHAASKLKTAEAARLLVENGAEVSVQDEAGWSPLLLASANGCLETVKFLVANGADTTATMQGTGWTPLHAAAQQTEPDIAKYYISELNFDVNQQDAAGRTALFFAARCGNVKVVQALLDANALPNITDYLDAGPLIAASRSGHLEAVELLVATDTGECLRHEDKTGHTAVWWAARSGNVPLFNLYRAHAKKVGVKPWRKDRMTDDDVDPDSLPPYAAGHCYCGICTLSVPLTNWPRLCKGCYGGQFIVCDDCFNAGFSCLDPTHREDGSWVYSTEYCDCKQHYPHTSGYVARPDLQPTLRRIFEEAEGS